MVSASELRLVAFLALAFRHTLADNTLVDNEVDTESEVLVCGWNCTVIDSDIMALKDVMKASITKKRSMRLVVTYEEIVDNKCAEQTSRNTTKFCQVCVLKKEKSASAEAIGRLASLVVGEEFREIQVTCNLDPTRTTATTPTYYRGSSSIFSQGPLVYLKDNFDCIDLNAGETDNLRPCLNKTKTNGINSTISERPLKPGEWPVIVLICLSGVFIAVFVHYSLAFLCLLSPTEVTEDGVLQIILEGASPVSFRSLLGNFFFSGDDRTIWHKTKTFILRVLFIPVPFFGAANYFDFKLHYLIDSSGLIPIVCCTCYCIQAVYESFSTVPLSFKAKPCFVCKFVKPRTIICRDKLPRLILNHLRLQPLILIECWRLYINCILKYSRMSIVVFPSSKVSIVYVLRFCLFIVFLCSIPAMIVILLIAVLILALIGMALTSPILILCNARKKAIKEPFVVGLAIRFVTIPAVIGAFCVIIFASVGTLKAFLLVVGLLFNEDSLPFLACVVLVLYYVWSSYSSFTNKYHELALALYKRYTISRCGWLTDIPLNTDQETNFPTSTDFNKNMIKIPKELFDIACEELMPLREGVCTLTLEITIIVSFVLIVFSFIMLSTVGATPILKALLTFLTLSFPKVVALYVDGGWQKKLQAMVIDEKVPKIVEEFINKTSGSTCGQENTSANVNAAISLSEEGIELINMQSL